MKKYLFLLVGVALQVLTVPAQTVVKDSVTGSPVAQASVLNEKGFALGQTDMEGRLPEIKGANSISISHIGYAIKKVKVAELGKELLLSPMTYPVKEVVKEMGKPHCLKLTCYLRKYQLYDAVVVKKDTVDIPPVLHFIDGIYNLYLFSDESINLTKARPLVTRTVLNNEQINGQKEYFFSISGMDSYIEKVKRGVEKGNFELRGDFYNQELYRIKKNETYRLAVIKRDTVNKTITVDVDHLARKGEQSFNLGVAKAQVKVNTESFLYQQTEYPKVGQGDLLAYRSVEHRIDKGNLLHVNAMLDHWDYMEFFPFEAEFLTSKEYKEDKKEVAASKMTVEDIDRIKKEINVPALSPELEQKVTETIQWIEEHQ